MQQEKLPPSWVLGTHFSRAVYYRSDTCIDASWLVDLPLKPIAGRRSGTLAGRTSNKPDVHAAAAGKGLVFITSAPSLDVFYQAAAPDLLQSASEEILLHEEEEDSIAGAQVEGEDRTSFSFPSVTACTTSSVCDSPPLNLAKDAWSFPLKLDEEINIEFSQKPQSGSQIVHSSANYGESLSKTPPRRSFSLNNLLSHEHEGMQICTSKASISLQAITIASKYGSALDSPQGSPFGSPTSGSPKNSQENSPTCKSKSTNSLCANTSPSCDPYPSTASRDSPVKRDMTRALSWSDHLSNATGNERAVLSAENWMIDLSQLLLGERFASGTHSRIYHGMYQDTPVAVKIIRQPDEDELLSDRLEKVFMQEVITLSCLQHQNVVKFVAACKKPPVLCVITEYLSGGSVRAFLHKREGQLLPICQVLQMALDIAYGMEYLHMKGVVHRDLKSENLVLGEDSCVKIVDFGVSCFESDCNSDAHDLGTYRWMAPEMLSQKPYTRKVDVYSFGIVLWELLTCHLPYEELGPVQAAFCVIHQNTRPPIPDGCPAFLRDLMCQCWSTEPEDRPEFWEILRVLIMCMEDITKSEGAL